MPSETGRTTSILASEVIGKDVYNASGEKIGTVGDILLETIGKEIMAVVRFGGAVTTADDSYPLPISVLEYSDDICGYFVPFTKEQIASGAASHSAVDATR